MGDDDRERLRAAAEKLENIFARQPYYFESATLTRDEVAAAQDIARGLLARLPPDDDGEDHSPDWLVSIGGKSQLDGSVAFFGPEPGDGRIPLLWIDVYPSGRTAVRLITDAGMMSHYLDRPTKGGIRRLLSALGVG